MTVTYAGRLERFFSHLLDTTGLLILKFLLIQSFGQDGIILLIGFVLDMAYYTYFLASSWQATPGQRLLSIYVKRTNGMAIDRNAAAYRFIVFILPGLPLYASFIPEPVGQSLAAVLLVFWFAPVLFTEQRAGFHDQLTRMRVVVGRADEKTR
jgi:uncharacterized RDD family membrane protein YckC